MTFFLKHSMEIYKVNIFSYIGIQKQCNEYCITFKYA
jgi:hypothetical protein